MIPAVVDGVFLPRHPRELLASVGFHPVPSIIGVTNDEYGLIIPMVSLSSNPLGACNAKQWELNTSLIL